MPCDTISETEIEFGQHTDPELLKKAMTSLGFQVNATERVNDFTFANFNTYESGSFVSGKFSFNQSSTESNTIKRAYSEQVVRASAKRFGWDLKEPKKEGNQIKFNVRKKV